MPVGYPQVQQTPVPDHSHNGAINSGGDLADYLRLSRLLSQTFAGPLVFLQAPDLRGGLVMGPDDFSISSGGGMSWFDGTFIHSLPAPHDLTDGRFWDYPDANGAFLCEGNGVKIARNYRQTAQTAAISSFNLLTAPTPGFYRVSAYIETTAETVAGTYTIPIGYTDAVGATSQNVINAVAVTGTGRTIGTPVIIEVSSGNVTAAVQIGLLTGTYNVRIVAERLP